MAKLRSISTAIWSDPFIEDLTPQQKLLFIYLITNEKTNMLGVYEVSNRKISFETGISVQDITNAFERFETLSKVRRVGNFIILCNFLKNQNFNKNMMKSAIDIYNGLPKELKFSDLVLNREETTKAFETLCKGFGMVRKREVEYEYELEDEKKENNALSPFDLIAKEKPSELQTWKMQNQKLIYEFDEMVDAFNNKASIEILSDSNDLDYDSAMLIYRLRNFARSWIGNQKGKVMAMPKYNDPDMVYYTHQLSQDIKTHPRSTWENFKANEAQGGYILKEVSEERLRSVANA